MDPNSHKAKDSNLVDLSLSREAWAGFEVIEKIQKRWFYELWHLVYIIKIRFDILFDILTFPVFSHYKKIYPLSAMTGISVFRLKEYESGDFLQKVMRYIK